MANESRIIKSFTLHPRVVACIEERSRLFGMSESATVETYVQNMEKDGALKTFTPGARANRTKKK